MAEMGEVPKVTFVLAGPREGYSGGLGGRFYFKDGELTVNADKKDKLKLILCNNYACNIKGEAPIWETKNGAAVKVGTISKPKPVVTAVTGDVEAKVVAPTPVSEAKTPDTKAAPKAKSD